jgi:hypothetical protein
VTTLSGGGEKTDEPFIGELTGKDNRSFVFADTDGFWNGQLDGDDTLSFCYMHTHSKSTVVSCSQVSERAEPRALACTCRASTGLRPSVALNADGRFTAANATVWRPRAGVRRQPLACPDGGRHSAWPCRIFASQCSCVR